MVARGMHGCWGACVVAGGVCGCQRGACVVARVCVVAMGRVCGCWGTCMVAGRHAWLMGGVHGKGGCAWQRGVCMVKGDAWQRGGGMRGKGGMCGIRRDTEIRSMSGRYASYWNALYCILCEILKQQSIYMAL